MYHTDLEVWKRSMTLVEKVYALTKMMNAQERYDFGSQINRAVVSIPSNIAEGAGRRSNKEFLRYLDISSGSLSELETQLMILDRLGLQKLAPDIQEDIVTIRAMIHGLKRSIALRSKH
ncbi:four helix bundle protein [Robertkochia sediminum]|uniref:four helix bundle protein n=1 Tax=Robertkochia sediminum TaxID=2785326 RepID=UPI0019342836|nr:four helix bundle protein [Robertkochia sediminum]MBL7473336.1 four helix bundle protein [Robertkochia sediminum]